VHGDVLGSKKGSIGHSTVQRWANIRARGLGMGTKSKARSPEAAAWQALYDYKWRKYRLQFLTDNPLCKMCAEEGMINPATVVHHKIAHKGDRELFWRRSNHEPLCAPHHDSTEQAREKGTVRPLIGPDGWPVDE
jgi:5-methylcytosine-specific restriction enzyme A